MGIYSNPWALPMIAFKVKELSKPAESDYDDRTDWSGIQMETGWCE